MSCVFLSVYAEISLCFWLVVFWDLMLCGLVTCIFEGLNYCLQCGGSGFLLSVFVHLPDCMQPHEGNLESLIVLALSVLNDGCLSVGNVLRRDVLSIIFCIACSEPDGTWEGKWRGKMRIEWVASSFALYVGTRSIQLLSVGPCSSTAGSRLNWHPRRFKWTRLSRWKTKSGFCVCAITFWTCYTTPMVMSWTSWVHMTWSRWFHKLCILS